MSMSWTDEIEVTAVKIFDLQRSCPGHHRCTEVCPRCACLLGLYEALAAVGKMSAAMEPVEVNEPEFAEQPAF